MQERERGTAQGGARVVGGCRVRSYDNDGSVTDPSTTNKGEVLGRQGRS